LPSASLYISAFGTNGFYNDKRCAQAISSEKLKKAMAAEKKGQFGEFPPPFIKLVFKKTDAGGDKTSVSKI